MSKYNEVEEALKSRLQTITTANGYTTNIGTVLVGVDSQINRYGRPLLMIHYEGAANINLDAAALHEKQVILYYNIFGVHEKGSTRSNLHNMAADIENALDTFESNQPLGLGYVTNITTVEYEPIENGVTDQGNPLWSEPTVRILAEVTMEFERGNA